jgi:hypothetical protein
MTGILPCKAIDRTAANVIFKKGFYEEYKHNKTNYFSDMCGRLKKPPIDPNFVDFTGKKYGDLLVIGYYKYKTSKEERAAYREKKLRLEDDGRGGVIITTKDYVRCNPKAHWLTKCVCGNYECFTSKALKRAFIERCSECQLLKDNKRKEYFRTHGKWPD